MLGKRETPNGSVNLLCRKECVGVNVIGLIFVKQIFGAYRPTESLGVIYRTLQWNKAFFRWSSRKLLYMFQGSNAYIPFYLLQLLSFYLSCSQSDTGLEE